LLALEQAIELEMRRRTPDRMSLNSSRSGRSARSDSVTSLDFDNAPQSIDLDENMLRLLGSLPQASEEDSGTASGTEEAERLCQLAARAQLEGRTQDAENLCQLAYESYRGRGATALEALKQTPPHLRQFVNASSPQWSPPSGGSPQRPGSQSASPSAVGHRLNTAGASLSRLRNSQDGSAISDAPSPPVSGGLPAGAAQQLQQLQQWSSAFVGQSKLTPSPSGGGGLGGAGGGAGYPAYGAPSSALSGNKPANADG